MNYIGFVEKCKSAMSFLGIYGFVIQNEVINQKYEAVLWVNEGICVEVIYDHYEYSLSLLFSYEKQIIDISYLYKQCNLRQRPFYQFHDECGFDVGINYLAEGLKEFSSKFFSLSSIEFKRLLEIGVLDYQEELNKESLKRADAAYLSGDYATAKNIYLNSLSLLSDVQKKRLKHIIELE